MSLWRRVWERNVETYFFLVLDMYEVKEFTNKLLHCKMFSSLFFRDWLPHFITYPW